MTVETDLQRTQADLLAALTDAHRQIEWQQQRIKAQEERIEKLWAMHQQVLDILKETVK